MNGIAAGQARSNTRIAFAARMRSRVAASSAIRFRRPVRRAAPRRAETARRCRAAPARAPIVVDQQAQRGRVEDRGVDAEAVAIGRRQVAGSRRARCRAGATRCRRGPSSHAKLPPPCANTSASVARQALERAGQDQRQHAELRLRRHRDEPRQHPLLHALVAHHVPRMDEHRHALGSRNDAGNRGCPDRRGSSARRDCRSARRCGRSRARASTSRHAASMSCSGTCASAFRRRGSAAQNSSARSFIRAAHAAARAASHA